jgi:hypothetical protein
MIGRFVGWLRRGWFECVSTWRDAQAEGDWPGHLFALAGVLVGAIGEESAEWWLRL